MAVNSENAPPGSNGRDPARPQDAPDTSKSTPASGDGSLALPRMPGASAGLPFPTSSSQPSGQPEKSDRPDASTAPHRVAAGLPLQPPPLAAAKSVTRYDQAGTGSGTTGLTPVASGLAGANPGRPAAAAAALEPRPATPGLAGGSATPGAPMSKLAAASIAPARVAVGVGEPEPPISGRPDGLASSLVEPKRITPRSPRAALEPDHVPVPNRPSRRARNPLVIVGNAVFTVLVLVLILAGGAAVIGKSRFEAPGPLQQDKIVTIPPRSGIMDIADLLTREGVVDAHRLVFIGGVFALKARSELKAGEYLFPKQASVKDVVETIVEGKVVQHQLTIPEGLTSEQVVARLLENDILTGNIKDVPREGSLLPDSYHFNRGFTREQMIQRMRLAHDRLVREVWERRNPDLPLKTPDQLVILASIIEKETGKPEERTRIAAVLTNRLKQKMKLQSDPTIIYGLVFGKGTLGHPLTKSEIAQPTPYNTYVIDGLPPGPIANPGRASIEAAANPARTKELYFVADGTGGHAFAESYDQHLKNVARLRVIEHEQNGEVRAPDVQAPATPAAPTRAAPAPRGKRGANGASSRAAGAAQ